MKRLLLIVSIVVVLIVCFLMIRDFAGAEASAPVQPIEFDHWQHVTKEEGPQLECSFCHEHADKSRHATVPNSATCMACHESTKTDSPEVQKLSASFDRGEQPAWKRVYWFDGSANIYFSHKPHIGAGVECSTCHGDVGQMHRVRREVDHTMGRCMDCHREHRASVDCYMCHR